MISPELLRRYSFFGGFALKELKELAVAGREQSLAEGELLFSEGDRADHLFFLADGEMETLIRAEEEGDISLSTLPPGEPVGWSALIEPHLYTASATRRPTESSPSSGFPRPRTSVAMCLVSSQRRSSATRLPSEARTATSSGIWPGSAWVAQPKHGS